MTKNDRQLGMTADITRRDFLNGVAVAAGAGIWPAVSNADDGGLQAESGYYPPSLTGMRGSHAGSFEVAHSARDGATWTGRETGEVYDLVVVGAGLSGLAAAYFYRQQAGPDATVLLIDNHDDFGGHAKRNEFQIDGRTLIGYGGTMLIEAPGGYPEVAKRLIREIGIDTDRFYTAYDQELYASLGLKRATFFDRETFGGDFLALGEMDRPGVFADAPLSDAAKADLDRLLANERHYLGDMSRDEQIKYLESHSYETYLRDRAGIGEEALAVLSVLPKGVWAVGIDALVARTAWSSAYPGFGDLELGIYNYAEDYTEPSIFHFPDGNASIARLLVRELIPDSAPGHDMDDIVTARFDYGKLDDRDSRVRLRLNSTVVRARHANGDSSGPVEVTYVSDGEAHKVTARRTVLACYHGMIPSLCPELPDSQRALLSRSLRAPLVYTNVLIRNWTSFAQLGVHRISCPGSYHHRIMLDYPVSMGSYRFPKSPEEPMVLHLDRTPGEHGLSAREQFTAGKRELLTTPFETFERNVRSQLGDVLGPGGFNPAEDIAAITVNRWPHGYAYGWDPDTDRVAFEPSQWPENMRHWERASKQFGNIAIAGIDAASNAMTEAAIEEAHRAVRQLID